MSFIMSLKIHFLISQPKFFPENLHVALTNTMKENRIFYRWKKVLIDCREVYWTLKMNIPSANCKDVYCTLEKNTSDANCEDVCCTLKMTILDASHRRK